MSSNTPRLPAPIAGVLIAFIAVIGAAAPAFAQGAPSGGEERLVDRVIALVNSEPILYSEVEEQLALLVASRRLDPNDSTMVTEARKQVLDQLIEERIIVDYAAKRGINVTDEQIAPQVEAALEEAKERIGDEARFQTELARQGLTLDALRDRYRVEMRKEAMAQRIIEREIRSKVKVTDTDVDTFFTNNRDQLPIRPTTYDLSHILVVPKPDANRRAAARAKASRALQRLESGESWDAVCTTASEDPNAKATKGDLGEAREGDFDPAFEAAIRDLEPGQRSGIVETLAGYHIIELLSRTDDTYRARHILILSQPTPQDVSAAIDRAAKARAGALAGEDWAVLVNSYSDDASTKMLAGKLGEVPASRLSPSYVEALDSLAVGGISDVLQGPTGFHIFRVNGKTAGGEYRLEDIRPQLLNMLTQQKLSEAYDKWIADVRKTAFVEVKG
jgi:peptidyl-prolyl cis-trans isomerase SurA